MEKEKKTISIYKKLADFQQECPPIFKGSKGYGYTYADLLQILEVINPLLKKNKLGYTQLINGNSLKTILFDTESDQVIESVTDIPQGVQLKGMNDFQVMGSGITYIRRYALSAMLGIVTDADNDAQGQQVSRQQEEVYKAKPEPILSYKKLLAGKISKNMGVAVAELTRDGIIDYLGREGIDVDGEIDEVKAKEIYMLLK